MSKETRKQAQPPHIEAGGTKAKSTFQKSATQWTNQSFRPASACSLGLPPQKKALLN
jgi:hypothetical protein